MFVKTIQKKQKRMTIPPIIMVEWITGNLRITFKLTYCCHENLS